MTMVRTGGVTAAIATVATLRSADYLRARTTDKDRNRERNKEQGPAKRLLLPLRRLHLQIPHRQRPRVGAFLDDHRGQAAGSVGASGPSRSPPWVSVDDDEAFGRSHAVGNPHTGMPHSTRPCWSVALPLLSKTCPA